MSAPTGQHVRYTLGTIIHDEPDAAHYATPTLVYKAEFEQACNTIISDIQSYEQNWYCVCAYFNETQTFGCPWWACFRSLESETYKKLKTMNWDYCYIQTGYCLLCSVLYVPGYDAFYQEAYEYSLVLDDQDTFYYETFDLHADKAICFYVDDLVGIWRTPSDGVLYNSKEVSHDFVFLIPDSGEPILDLYSAIVNYSS